MTLLVLQFAPRLLSGCEEPESTTGCDTDCEPAPPPENRLPSVLVGKEGACLLDTERGVDPSSGYGGCPLWSSRLRPGEGQHIVAATPLWLSACLVYDDGDLRCSHAIGQQFECPGAVGVYSAEWSLSVLNQCGDLQHYGLDGLQSLRIDGPARRVDVSERQACWLDTAGGLTCADVDGGETWTAPGPYADVQVPDYLGGCALRDDGGVDCWDNFPFDERDAPVAVDLVAFTVQVFFSCGLDRDREIVCWGSWGRAWGTEVALPPGPFAEIYSSYFAVCAVAGPGDVVCWYPGLDGDPTPQYASEGIRWWGPDGFL